MASHQRGLTTWQKATALVPLALLSGAWTTSLAFSSTATAATGGHPRLPDGSSIPSAAIKAPASVSLPGQIAPGVPQGSAGDVIESASTNGIPAAALAAYQRAAQVIDAADPSCHLEWPLIAAIGRVESDHGRYGGNTLSERGISEPGIYGIPLDGSNGTATISDTDAGQFDEDPVYDRAVGPMQFIPSTWAVVGVDGDGDGRRDPQDIDDAALATAVYLCSGNENLATPIGQQAAVYRYNHSQDYVNLVLSIMRAYAHGDYAAIPNASAAPTTFTPYDRDSVVSPGTRGDHPKRKPTAARHDGSSAATGSSGSGSPAGAGSSGSTGSQPVPSSPTGPSSDPSTAVTKVTDTVKKVTDPVTTTTTDTVTALQKAGDYCQSHLSPAQLTAVGGLDACASAYLDGGAAAVTSLISGISGITGGLLGN
jgi:Transglycosylase SLT domain